MNVRITIKIAMQRFKQHYLLNCLQTVQTIKLDILYTIVKLKLIHS